MGIRETLNEKPAIGYAVGGVVLLLALILLINAIRGGGGDRPIAAGELRQFYTVDDGQTRFTDTADRVPPFQHEGREAVIARVWRCGETEFVNHLERYPAVAARRVNELRAQLAANPDQAEFLGDELNLLETAGMEVKRPGDARWVSTGSTEGMALLEPRCPPGSSGDLSYVNP